MGWGAPRDPFRTIGPGVTDEGFPPIAPISAALAGPAEPPIAAAVKGARRPGMFSRDGSAWTILGALGDALATAGGGQAVVIPAMMRQRQEQQESKTAQLRREQQRAQELDDYDRRQKVEQGQWVARQEYERANPAPQPLSGHERTYQFIRQARGEAAANQYLDAIAQGPLQALDTIDEQGNTVRQYIRPGAVSGQQAPPQVLDALPPGAVPLPPQGGAGPRAPRTFPR
jgi:hypothetical protein